MADLWVCRTHDMAYIETEFCSSQLFSSSYDCSFRRFDLATHTSTELYALTDEDHLINAFELTPTGQEAWLVDSGGALSHVDMREGGKRRRWEISGAGSGQRKLGGVSVNRMSNAVRGSSKVLMHSM